MKQAELVPSRPTAITPMFKNVPIGCQLFEVEGFRVVHASNVSDDEELIEGRFYISRMTMRDGSIQNRIVRLGRWPKAPSQWFLRNNTPWVDGPYLDEHLRDKLVGIIYGFYEPDAPETSHNTRNDGYGCQVTHASQIAL